MSYNKDNTGKADKQGVSGGYPNSLTKNRTPYLRRYENVSERRSSFGSYIFIIEYLSQIAR